jgi:hypothetical protein
MDQPSPRSPDRSDTPNDHRASDSAHEHHPTNTNLSYLALADAVRERLRQLAITPHSEWTEDMAFHADATVGEGLTALGLATQRERIVQRFMARHEQFHPEFWAADKNCWECEMCANLMRTQDMIEVPPDTEQDSTDALTELNQQCDRFGLPHSVSALVAHLEASATFRAAADAGSIAALQVRITELEAAPPYDWETFVAQDGDLALRPTLESAYAGAQHHIANQRAELAGYKQTQRELQDELFAAQAETKQYRAALRAMIQQSVDTENEGLTPDDPDWMTLDSFFDHVHAWTPSVTGDALDLLRAALAATNDFYKDDEDPDHILTAFAQGEHGTTEPPPTTHQAYPVPPQRPVNKGLISEAQKVQRPTAPGSSNDHERETLLARVAALTAQNVELREQVTIWQATWRKEVNKRTGHS